MKRFPRRIPLTRCVTPRHSRVDVRRFQQLDNKNETTRNNNKSNLIPLTENEEKRENVHFNTSKLPLDYHFFENCFLVFVLVL